MKKKNKYFIKSWSLGIFKFGVAILGSKFSIRFSVEKGWDD